MKSEIVLEVKDVTKSFGQSHVLRDANLQVRAGEMVGIVGENGAGKSTLLKIVVGLLSPDKGRVVARGKSGYCPQEQLSFETLTVFENFYYFAVGYGLIGAGNSASWQHMKDELLERFRFKQYERTLVHQLSGGTRQKLNLSLAVLHSPHLLILDEPYSGFDWETYLQFWEFAGILRKQGHSILTVSHFVHDRSKFDRLFELHDGNLTCV